MLFENLSQKLSNVFKKLRSKGKLTSNDVEVALREIKLSLLEADVNYKVVKKFNDRISELATGQTVLSSLTPAQQVVDIVNKEIALLMGSEQINNGVKFSSKETTLVMICGLQGSGKTTHCAKLAHYYVKKGHRVMLVACDVYRPAAVEQLKVVGTKAGAYVYTKNSTNPIEIARASLSYAKDYGYDLVLFDTAGRLHVDEMMMNELLEMKQSINFNEILMVVDCMMGQDAVNVANVFNSKLGIDGYVLTKLDSDSRGGAALSIVDMTGKPIKFIGTGEKLGDFELFKPDRMSSRILGMGDVLTLIEKAKENVAMKDVAQLTGKLKNNSFDMNDLLIYMQKLSKLGPLRKFVELLPGVANKLKDSDFETGELRLIKTRAIISSMTLKERRNPDILNFSRKTRIASGSGTKVSDINILLKQFTQMRKFFKQFHGKNGLFKKGLMSQFIKK